MKKNSVMIIGMLIALLVPGLALSSSIGWKGYEQGMTDARNGDKKIMVHFRTDWCTYCKKMDATTFQDQGVVDYLNEYFIPIKVDGDREKSVTVKYKVKGFPANWFLSEDIEQVFHIPGYIPPDRFLLILKYFNTDSYKKMKFKDFVQSQ